MLENNLSQNFHLSRIFRGILGLLFVSIFFLLPMMLIELFFNLGYPIFEGVPAYLAKPWLYIESYLVKLWTPYIVRIIVYGTLLIVVAATLWRATKYYIKRTNGSKRCIRWFGIYLCKRHARVLSIVALGSLFFYGYIIIQFGMSLISFGFRPPEDYSMIWIVGSVNVLIIMTILTLFSNYTFLRMRKFDRNPSYILHN